jgi:hypothetical protein
MFEAKCEKCESVYSIEQESMPAGVECLCGCTQFNVEEANLIAA